MNWNQFKKNIGLIVRLSPTARRVDPAGNELQELEDDWRIDSFPKPESVMFSNLRTGHTVELGKDHIYDFRSDPARSSVAQTYGFLILKMQIILQGPKVRLMPNTKPGERVGPQLRQRPQWTSLARVDASQSIPPTAIGAKVQYRLWTEDATIPLMIRIAANAEGHFGGEHSGPSGVVEQMITEPQAFYISFSHPHVQFEVQAIGWKDNI